MKIVEIKAAEEKPQFDELPPGKFYTKLEDIQRWLDGVKDRLKVNITSIDNDGTVHVSNDTVFLNSSLFSRLHVKFANDVRIYANPKKGRGHLASLEGFPSKGRFANVNKNKLTTLIGYPDNTHSAKAEDNHLTTLEGCPKDLSDWGLEVSNNKKLTSLRHGPTKADRIEAGNCGLTSLDGCAKHLHLLWVPNNKLTSMEGGPEKAEIVTVNDNKLTSLDHFPKEVRDLDIRNNLLTSLHDVHKKFPNLTEIYFFGNPIKECILGLCLIPNLKKIVADPFDPEHKTKPNSKELDRAIEIINKHLGKGKSGMIDAQAELIENDLDDFADV